MPYIHGTRYTTISRGAARDAFAVSDIAELLYDFDAGSYAYSDAGTTLCVADDPVYRWYDATRTVYIEQATLVDRPTYKIGANGKPYLQFDGITDRIRGSLGSQSILGCLAVFLADIKSTASDYYFDVRNDGDGNPIICMFGSGGVVLSRYRGNNGTLVQTASGGTPSAGTWATWANRISGTTDVDSMKNNAVESTVNSGGLNAGTFNQLTIGAENSNALSAEMNISRFLLFAPAPSSEDQTSLQTYLAANAPTY